MSLSKEFAEFICHPRPLDETTAYLLKRSMADALGAMAAGSQTASVVRAAGLVSSNIGEATIAGRGTGFTAEDAAFVNGIAVHELELDDTSSSNLGHPTAAVLPALLALAEELDRGGMALLESFAVATEIECKIGRICARELHRKGWHASSITGVIGAAAGCGSLLGLGEEQMMDCLGIAASMASGIRQNFGTSTKSIHMGKTAQDGIRAARLALAGFTSSEAALDGREGYLSLYADLHSGLWNAERSLGDPYDVCEPGFTLKRYPSCSSTHRAVDAILELIGTHGIREGDIEEIRVGLSDAALRELVTPVPKTPDEAKFSIGFQVGLSVAGIDNVPANYTEENICLDTVQNIIHRLKQYNEGAYNDLPADMGVGPALVSIVLKNGRRMEAERIYPVGHLTDPVSDDELWGKYMKCAQPVLGQRSAAAVYEKVQKLESVTSVRELARNLY